MNFAPSNAKYKLLKVVLSLLTRQIINKGFVQDIVQNNQSFSGVVKCLNAPKKVWSEEDRGDFIWIVGLPRTCGAYLTRALRQNLCSDTPSAVYKNESIPAHHRFSTWNSDWRLNIEFYQLFSFLRSNNKKYDVVVKKNSGLGARPDSLVPMMSFNRIETILLTIRPPGENFVSWRNSGLELTSLAKYSEVNMPRSVLNGPDWDSEETMKFFMDAWEKYYMNFLERLPLGLKKKTQVVDFGNANNVIRDILLRHGADSELDQIRNRSAQKVPAFFNSEAVISRQNAIYGRFADSFLSA